MSIHSQPISSKTEMTTINSSITDLISKKNYEIKNKESKMLSFKQNKNNSEIQTVEVNENKVKNLTRKVKDVVINNQNEKYFLNNCKELILKNKDNIKNIKININKDNYKNNIKNPEYKILLEGCLIETNNFNKQPPRINQHFAQKFKFKIKNVFSNINNSYGSINNEKTPNIFLNHLLIQSENEKTNSLSICFTQRLKSKNVLFIYYKPKI